MTYSLEDRKAQLTAIGDFITSDDVIWTEAKQKAESLNPWFTQQFIDLACDNIAQQYTDHTVLEKVIKSYPIPDGSTSKTLGIINAGNIPLVGFHDFLVGYLCGLKMQIKLSSKDEALFQAIHRFASDTFEGFGDLVTLPSKLENCDAYIATGGDTTSIYFEKYFGNKANIIRKHRNSVAILDGTETEQELVGLADDVHLYFGLGCRNVTHLYVPEGYDFVPMLEAWKKYDYFKEHSKYMNNYDYQLAIYIINGDEYMSTPASLLLQRDEIASPVSVCFYSYYRDASELRKSMDMNKIQCVVSKKHVAFGQSQRPSLTDFPDGEDTIAFCLGL